MSWHEKALVVGATRAFEINAVNDQENNVMGDNSTASPSIIPFSFGKQQVRTLLIDDQPWFYAVDVCASLGLADTNKALIGLDDDEKCEHEQYSGSGRKPILINESGLYSLILRSRKAEAKRFKKWVTAEVLPAIRKHGRYEDRQAKMPTLMDELIGMGELSVIKGLIRDKSKAVPAEKRQSFALTMHNRLHTRFNVPRTELIPANQFESACNFIAAYALEGELMSKEHIFSFKRDELSRYLVSFDRNGEQQVTPVPYDACVLSHRELIAGMVVAGDIPVSTEELFEFAMAALSRLKGRSEYLAKRAAA